jgi:TRAP-type C4-dicarboxylate transport system permease small subunit
MNSFHKAEIIFDKIIDYMLLAAAVIVVMDAVVVSVDVILRKFLGFTWAPLYEIITYTLLWMTFLGTTAIMRMNSHVKMDSVTGRLSTKVQALLNGVTSSLCALLVVGIVFYTVKLTVSDYQTNFILATIVNPPKWPIEIIIPIGFFMLLIQIIRNAHGFFATYKAMSRGTQVQKNNSPPPPLILRGE